MTSHLDRLNEMEKEARGRDLRDLKEKLALLTIQVASLEASLKEPVDYARLPHDNVDAINDLDDREKVAEFIHEKTSFSCSAFNLLGIFSHYSNVPSLCEHYGVDCPQWFIDKYCV